MDFLKKRLVELNAIKGARSGKPFDVRGFEIVSIRDEEFKKLVNFSSNDYLGLAGDKELTKEFFADFDFEDNMNFMSASSARPLTGTSLQHDLLEKRIAHDYKKSSALVFNSGYHANSGTLAAITNKDDLILADKLVHASIIDGLLLSKASFKRFSHNDVSHLEKLLEKYHHDYARIWIVTESIFSMDGDFAPLKSIVELKKRYSAYLYVDEAHAIGCYGDNGLGLAEKLNLIDQIDVLVGVFGKATAGVGAFVVSSQLIIDSLINYSRSWLFSTALPPINIAWNYFIWQRLPSFDSERKQLQKLTNLFRKSLLSADFPIIGESHIIPLMQAGNNNVVATSDYLQDRGFLAMPIRSPTVKKGSERVRFSLTANLPESCIERLIEALKNKH